MSKEYVPDPAKVHTFYALCRFVPVCLAASHIAYGSIRMEPVFMILGQSAALAADIALTDNIAVQDVDYRKLRPRLEAAHQILEWKKP